MVKNLYEKIKHKTISFVRGPRNIYLVPAAILIAAVIIALGIAVKNSSQNQTYLSPQDINPEQFKPMVGFNAPLFQLKTSRGTEINLEELRGQNILLVFWAAQCQYSQRELADLKQFTNIYRGQVLVLAIDYMEPAQTIKEYEQKESINFPILLDEKGELAKKYAIEGTPAHFLIDKEGKISAMWPSYAPLANLEGLLQSLK